MQILGVKRQSGENALKTAKKCQIWKVPKKESFQIRKVFRKGKFSNEESAEAKANKESSVRRLFEIQIADLFFLVQRCAHTAAVISSYLGSKISKRCSSSSAFNIQISKEAPPKKECMDSISSPLKIKIHASFLFRNNLRAFLF